MGSMTYHTARAGSAVLVHVLVPATVGIVPRVVATLSLPIPIQSIRSAIAGLFGRFGRPALICFRRAGG